MYFDIAMPLTLFSVTLVSLFLNKKTEEKLKGLLEEKEFSAKDAVLLVALMVVVVFFIVFLREIVVPLMILFLFAYSMLLFIFTYIFSNKRWYVAILSPAIFILLYVFLRDTAIWSNYFISIYGVIFAILITLYIGSLFTWKSAVIFTALLTVADIILVLITGTMREAAQTTMSLSFPVVVIVPIIPLILTEKGLLVMYLGLGDFFFAGLLAIQTFKKYEKRFAILSTITMAISFFIFEIFLLNYWQKPFPGTLMIICGWLPLVLLKNLKMTPS
jgi:presenilin-like A22 family membrane protease